MLGKIGERCLKNMDQINLFKEFEKIFIEPKEVQKESKEKFYAYSPFALQDALGEKNIKGVWIEYQRLVLQGVEAEDLIHKIISKVRDMVAISAGASASDLGIKDYPYSKSKKDLKNWKQQDLKNFYTKLVSIYHESRMGKESLETALEKTLLSI